MLLKLALMTAAALACAAAAGFGAEKSAVIGPWDVRRLQSVTPASQIADTQQVKEGETDVTLTSLYYEGEPWMGKPTRVFAYYARPARAQGKKLPAVVLVHGGGGKAFPQWARLWAARGYAALAMDLAGHGPDGARLPDGGPDQGDDWKFLHLKDGLTNAWPYQAVAAVIRGVSLLRGMPEVDRNRIGVTGISWGGYLTCIVMSLDDRLKAAVPVYGCGFLHENSAWVPVLNGMPEGERRQWVENFDPSRYLPRCKIPVLWVNGTNDFAYPLDSYQKSYRAARGPRTLCVTVNMPHGHEPGWARPEIGAFMDGALKKVAFGSGLGTASAVGVQEKTVRALYQGPSARKSAQLHWTTDLGKPWQQREWKSAPARVNGLYDIEATLPSERPAVFFLTMTDLNGMVVSTEHGELPAR